MNLTSLNIDDTFFQEEVRCNYTISESMKKVWAIELDLLKKFIEVCEKHSLAYYADSGTLLGAVRHHGFIPWDDDIDVVMPRHDYQILCESCYSEFSDPYFLQTEYSDPGSARGHAQLRNSETTGILESELDYHYTFNQGIFIDIFPLDMLPEPSLRENFWQELRELRHKSLKFTKDHTRKGDLTPNPYYRELELRCQQFNDTPSKLWGTLSFSGGIFINIHPVQEYTNKVFLPFEMLKISCPIGYANILIRCYGVWRKFKPNSSSHGRVIFNTEMSYKTYIKNLL